MLTGITPLLELSKVEFPLFRWFRHQAVNVLSFQPINANETWPLVTVINAMPRHPLAFLAVEAEFNRVTR
jgi:hypothetical protein